MQLTSNSNSYLVWVVIPLCVLLLMCVCESDYVLDVCVYMYDDICMIICRACSSLKCNACSCVCVSVICKDIEQWEKLSNVIGDSCLLLSNITYKSKAPPLPGVRGHILKQIHETTVSDLIRITSEHQGNRSTKL